MIALGVTFAVGLVIGRSEWPMERMPALEQIAGDGSDTRHMHVHATTTYVCPMHPQVVSDKPGTCPICGMALVPVKQDGVETEAGTDTRPVIRIASEVIDNLGVKTALVKRTTLVRRIETPGFVQEIQPGQTARVQAPFDARIVTLHFKPGQWLEQGKPLVVLESAALLAAEQAHLAILAHSATAASGAPDAAASKAPPDVMKMQAVALDESRLKLATLGLSTDAIRKLEQASTPSSQLTLYTPYPGAVTNLRVKAGDSVPHGTPLFELSGMARASVLANAFQRDAAWIQTGHAVEVRLPHVSNQVWSGVVNQGAVSLDPNSQNIGVRLSFTAPPQLLKSAMYVVATIFGDAREGVLSVPQQALIRTEAEDRVIIALGNGRFKPVPVHIGIETGDSVEILSGLKEGDQVVVSAQFLIDSESSLQASYLRMTGQ
jgi:Cu(I)/Ag(I) efflux system membrane fusion protein